MEEISNQRARFRIMTEGTYDDWQLIGGELQRFASQLPDRLIAQLGLLRGDACGFPVDRLEHCLQTATLAHQAGRDEEYVVCALLHDIGDTLGPLNHADVAAVIVEPFVSEENHWLVKHHAIFQGYYFFHFLGLDRNKREKFRGHPHFERTEEFCRVFDQVAFDPNFRSMPLEAFAPMLQRIFRQPRRSIYLAEAAE
ncbi:MAG TPA: HD domain-containing protein [Bradyrhizobium sp.]|nr:HD domain-containing protein [Stellaceae bacterium]HUN98666.1 HD domain-containing protein [Bradyrhizobium sp.]